MSLRPKRTKSKQSDGPISEKMALETSGRQDTGPFQFELGCSECHSRFNVSLSREPTRVLCPNGHFTGVWSYAGTVENKCKLCGGKIIGVRHVRVRHDIVGPKGQQIQVKGTSEETNAVFEHLMSHPEILKVCVDSGLVKVG